MEYFFNQNQQMMDQKKDHKMVYWGDTVVCHIIDCALLLSGCRGAGEIYFGSICMAIYMNKNSNNRIDLQLS